MDSGCPGVPFTIWGTASPTEPDDERMNLNMNAPSRPAAALDLAELQARTPVRTCTFDSLTIRYDERVLAPRAWTAEQSRWAAELLVEGPEGAVLELCAGVGHIGLLAVSQGDRTAVLVDRDPIACAHALSNVAAAGLSHRVEVRQAAVDAAVRDGEVFALAIVDPPWVPSNQTQRFPEDPLGAIDGGVDGLSVARACIEEVDRCLHRDGVLLLQLGTQAQVDALGDWFSESSSPEFEVTEVRTHGDRGVLALLRRPAARPGGHA